MLRVFRKVVLVSIFVFLLINTVSAQTGISVVKPTAVPAGVGTVVIPTIPPFFPVRIVDAVKAYSIDKIPETLRPAFLQLQQGQTQEARDAVMTCPKNQTPQCEFIRGVSFALENNHSEALAAYGRARNIKISNSDITFFKGLSEYALTQFEAAQTSFQEALWFEKFSGVTPDFVEYSFAAALSQSPKPQALRIIEILTQSISKYPTFPDSRIAMAKIELLRSNKPAALSQLRAGLAANPTNNAIKLSLLQTLLTDADRALEKSSILEAGKIADELETAKTLSEAEERVLAPLHIRALASTDNYAQANKLLSKYLKKYSDEPSLVTLKSQLQVEAQAIATPATTPTNG